MNQIINYIISSKDFLEAIQSIVTITAIIVGGFWSYRLFWLRRQRYPRAIIKHEVSHIELTRRYILLNISVEIVNIGDVILRIKRGVLRIQQILPLSYPILKIVSESKDLKEELNLLVPEEDHYFWNTEIPWPLIKDSENEWEAGNVDIEPGGQETIRYDFILDNHIRLIRIYSFFEDSFKRPVKWSGISSSKRKGFPYKRRKTIRIGWDLSTMYHIKVDTDSEFTSDRPLENFFK